VCSSFDMENTFEKWIMLFHRFESGDGAFVGSTQEQAEDHGGIGSHAVLGVMNRAERRLIRVSSWIKQPMDC
jgi:hypothetical protein